MKKGKLIILSAPSGAGKTTIARYLLEKNDDIGFSISATTRPKRDKEKEGLDYYFLSKDDFTIKIEQNEFVEWEEVYGNIFYGTLKIEVERLWNAGKNVLFDVDVKGGLRLKELFKDRALAIFVKPPTIEALEQRLRLRNTESEESIKKRIAKAEFEFTFEDRFDKILLNNDLALTLLESQIIVREFID